jgi:hypothetical protein
MIRRNNLTAYFSDQKVFNTDEESLRTCLKHNKEECQNIKVDHTFPDGALPIHYACLYNSTKFFMNPKLPHTQINIPGGSYNSTPMMFTINRSNYKILLSFLLNGADIFLTNSRSMDVLDFCVLYEDVLGMILILSFIEKPITIDKYLKQSQKENSKEIEEFLAMRKNEIEGKNVDENNFYGNFSLSKPQLISALVCGVLCFFFKEYKWIIAAFYFFIFCPFIIWSPFPFISNVLFSAYAYYDLYNAEVSRDSLNKYIYPLIIFHFLCFLGDYFIDAPLLKITKIKDAKSLISNLILKDKYDNDDICFKCLKKKLIGNKHCERCKGCVHGQIFHCPLLGKCISSKRNEPIWALYNFFTLILYLVGFLINVKSNNQALYVYIICFLSNCISRVMFMVANGKRQSRIQAFIKKNETMRAKLNLVSAGKYTVNSNDDFCEWLDNLGSI